MANHHPRRAIGAAQRRTIEERLRRHADFMRIFQAQGMSRDDASRKAFQMVKAGAKPQDMDDPPIWPWRRNNPIL
jgi:hypothetical protein